MSTKTSVLGRKVAILGAAGGIGQPLSLLLKTSQYISELFLHDIVDTNGIGVDLSHIDTKCQVKSFSGLEQLSTAVKNADLVLIPAGMPRKPGMQRSDLFKINADIIRDLIKSVAANAPNAWIGIITNPVNITVPIAAGILKSAGAYKPSRLFGVTTLDSARAHAFAAKLKNLNPESIRIPVLGGHSGDTIVPIFSSLRTTFSEEELKNLTKEVQEAGTMVVEAKKGKGSATLSMAYSAARFAQSVCRAMNGEKDIVECAYVESKADVSRSSFFASPLLLGRNGIEKNFGLGELSEFEEKQVEIAMDKLINEQRFADEYLKLNGFLSD